MTDVNAWSELERTEIERDLERLLASTVFAPSLHLQHLLRYLLEETLAGRSSHINQTSIAIDVLGRDAQFDPSVDSLVRVEASRLRTKLREYYYEEGKEDTVRFELPKGGYIPQITITQTPDATQDEIAAPLEEPVVEDQPGIVAAEIPRLFRYRNLPVLVIGLFTVALLAAVFNQYILVDGEPESNKVVIQNPPLEATTPAAIPPGKSVAVLPFANHSAVGEEAAFFADGLHDDLLTYLSKISDMKVISRTSVMQYRDTQKTMKTIGNELNVATLLEGGVQRAGNQIRINVQLIDADTDEHLWAEVYDRELTAANIFAIQSEIATAIANALRATLSPEEQERIAAVPTENLAAYEAYLLGKQRMAKRSIEGLAEAADYFEQAVALDPAFALAYVGLSDTYQLQTEYSGLPKEEMFALAEVAINKALALNDKSGEAYASLGHLKQYRQDFDGAEVAYIKALTLNPNYATTYHWYGGLKEEPEQYKSEEALALYRKGAQLDPLSAIINTNIAGTLEALGRFDEALVQHEKVIEVAPTSTIGYAAKARFYVGVSGRFDEAFPWYRKAFSLDPDSPTINALIATLFWDLGDDSQTECWVNRAMELGLENFYSNEAMQLFVYLHRGNETQALAYAYKALKIQPRPPWPYSLATLRNHDLRLGQFAKARDRYEKSFPELLAKDKPRIGRSNYRAAIDLAAVLQQTGEQERADWLLNDSLKYIQSNPRLSVFGYGIKDVDIYALQGKKEKAMTALRQAIDEGWRGRWRRINLENNLNLESIRNEPEFQAMLAEIKADMAGQLARVKAMEKEKDVCFNP